MKQLSYIATSLCLNPEEQNYFKLCICRNFLVINFIRNIAAAKKFYMPNVFGEIVLKILKLCKKTNFWRNCNEKVVFYFIYFVLEGNDS